MPQTPQHGTRSGPLANVKVLDLTIAMAGPMCTQRMAEMGADVIKIEAPGGGDFSRHWHMAGVTKFGDSVCFVTLNRGKRSLVLDLKNPAGRAALYRLVKQADVFVQNFRPRVASKLGIDYATLQELNPRLVYASISGYGEDGPMKDRPGQDLLLQSFTGLTMNGGSSDGLPQASPLYMVDVSASHMACEGILAALVARATTGVGDEIKVSMLAAIMEMQCQEITSYLNADAPPIRGETPQVSVYMEPPYGIYPCASGHLAVAQADLEVLADAIDCPRLCELKHQRPDQRDNQAVAQWASLIYREVAARLVEQPATTWDDKLTPLGVWCAVVNDYAAFLSHPQTQPYMTRLDHPTAGSYRTIAPAIAFSSVPQPALTTAPGYGANSRTVLDEFGFSDSEVEGLVTDDVVVAG